MLAYSNDVGYEVVFVEQLKNFLNEGDLVIAFSGSGNSENVIKAIEFAQKKGAITVGFCGFDGGKLKKSTDYSIHINVNDMQMAEDAHLIVAHILMQVICDKLGVKYC
jgi:D-sedoheptulose 7-phosphate isomerase